MGIKKNVYLKYTFLFLVLILSTFAYFIIYDKSLLWFHDGIAVNYMKQIDLKHTLSKLFETKKIPFWSWEIGLGSDIIGSYNSMAFIDPINALYTILPVSATDYAYAMSVFTKLFLSGIFFIGFMKELGIKNNPSLIGSICYVFSGWAIKASTHQDFFLEGIVLFPLLIWSVERILKKKTPIMFVIVTSLYLICSPYHAFMSAIIMLFYLTFRLIELKKEDGSIRIIRCFINFAMYSILSVFMAAFFIFPVIYTILNNLKDPMSYSFFNFYNLVKYYFKIPLSLVTLEEGGGGFSNYSNIGMPVICLFMLPVFLKLRRKFNALFKILIICFITFLLPGFSMILNGFRYPTNRWMFIFIFFIAFMTTICLDNLELIREKEIKQMNLIIYFIFFWTLFIGFFYTGKTSAIGLISLCGVFLIGKATLSCLHGLRKGTKQKYSKLLFLISINIVLIITMYFAPTANNFIEEEKDLNEISETLNNSPQKVVNDLNDSNNFYRVDLLEGVDNYTKSTDIVNESMFFGFKPVYSYMPGKDKDWDAFNRALLLSSNLKFRPTCMSNDNRTRIDTLLGVKYFIGTNSNDTSKYKYKLTSSKYINDYAGYSFYKAKNINGIDIMQNRYSIGLGSVYTSYIPQSEFMKLDYLDREQALMQSAVIPDKELKRISALNINNSTPKYKTISINYKAKSEIMKSKKFKITEDNKSINLKIDNVENAELYVFIENMVRTPLSMAELEKIKFEDKRPTVEEKLNFQRQNKYEDIYSNFSISASYKNIEKSVFNSSERTQGVDAHDFMINLGYYKATDGTISLLFDNTGEYNFDSIRVLAVPMDDYDDQAIKLVNNKLNIEKIDVNEVTGHINSSDDGILYLSIIHNDGWNVYIDGKKEKTIKTNIGFTGVPISAGKHNVQLLYRPYGFKFSVVLTIIGCVSFILLCFIWKKKLFGGIHEIYMDK